MNEAILHILVGVDFSDSSDMAMAHALKLARRTGARLHICHVVPESGVKAPLNLGLNIPQEFPQAREARTRLERLKARIGPNLDVELHLRIGNPLASMLALIQELKPDLVIVCSHGKGLLARTFLGSVSNRLVELSPVPVMVVPTPGREASLNQPAPPIELELPSVGRAVAANDGLQIAEGGIAGTSGTEVRLH